MQPITPIDISIVVLPSVVVGAIFGYLIGEMKTLRLSDRILLSIVSSIMLGIIIPLLLVSLLPFGTFSFLLSFLSVLGGLIFGLHLNWTPPPEPLLKSHIVYEYDDEDDEFEREIDRALGRKQ